MFQTSMSETEIMARDPAYVTSNTAPSGTQSSPWGGVKTPPWGSPAAPPCSLEDVMSEELVKQLQQDERQEEGDSR